MQTMQTMQTTQPSTYVVDVDNTICISESGCDYSLCRPIPDVVARVNQLYGAGARVVLFTARGMRTFNGDVPAIERYHRPILEQWLSDNFVMYHELIFGKPWGENVHYVDDKNLSIGAFLNT